jgi:hypothetical protein
MAVMHKPKAHLYPRVDPRGQIRTGITVEFEHGLSKMKGLVVEDLGPIGVGGRHLFRILFPKNGNQATAAMDRAIELPENVLTPIHN